MATTILSGSVDTLASGTKWLIEIDFITSQPNLIQQDDDTNFTTDIGNWYYQMDTSWDAGGYLYVQENSTPGNYMELQTNSVNRLVYSMEKNKKYKISMRIKSVNEPIDLRMGLMDIYANQYAFSVLGNNTWVTLEQEFYYNSPSAFRNPVVFFDTFWDQNNEVYIDWIKLELLDGVAITDSEFAVVDFGEWIVGSEDLEPAYVDGIMTTLTIRPLGGNMETNFRPTLVSWMETFATSVGRVSYYDATVDETPLVWRGKIDPKSVEIDLMENTLRFDILDFTVANADIACNTNPFAWDIENIGAPLNAYRTIEELVLTYSNYMSPFITADTFYTSIDCDSTIRGWDLLNRIASIQGYTDGGITTKLGVFGTRYFSDHYESPYGSTLGELMNDIAYAFQVKITPWKNGEVRINTVYDIGGTATSIPSAGIKQLEQGMLDMDQRGTKINIVGTRTTFTPPYSNFTLYGYVPSQTACVDGAGNTRKFVKESNLMFLNDRADVADSTSLVADLVSQSGSYGSVTQSYFVNNTTYVTPNRFHAMYYDTDHEENIGWVTWLELHKQLVALGFLKPKKYIRLQTTGVNFDPATVYSVEWDTDRYKVQAMRIDYVNNETELFLISL